MTIESAVSGREAPARSVARRAWGATAHFRPVLALVIVLFVFFALTQPVFLELQNLKNLLTAVSVLWVAAMGMTFVVLTGGVDLSVGAIAALTGIVLAKLLGLGLPAGLAIVLGLAAATAIGLFTNGLLIGALGLSFFVVTLGTMIAIGGLVTVWTNTQSYYISSNAIARIGGGNWLGVPILVWVMAAVFLVARYVLQRTYFGRDVYAVGGSLPAARLSGVRTSLTISAVYGISALCAGMAGIIVVARSGAASPIPDGSIALQAAAAILLGGTTLAGGSGGVGGTAFGVLFIGVLQNGLAIAGVPSFWQQVVTGVILISAVAGDRLVGSGGDFRSATRWMRPRSSPEDLEIAEGDE